MIEKTTCGERDALVEYLYDEIAPEERERVEQHLASCAECRETLEGMRGVRSQLAAWTLPELAGRGAGAAAMAGAGEDATSVRSRRWSGRPWWAPAALAAAAVVLLAVAAALANLQITYGSDGLTIRTGWSSPAQAARDAAASVPAGREIAATPVRQSVDPSGTSPWKDDLAALERRLRAELQSASAAPRAGTPAPDNARLMQRVQDLVEQSEQRQRRELALRMAQLVRDFDAQRQTDLVRIQQGIGQIEGNTAVDRQLLNYLVRASQRP